LYTRQALCDSLGGTCAVYARKSVSWLDGRAVGFPEGHQAGALAAPDRWPLLADSSSAVRAALKRNMLLASLSATDQRRLVPMLTLVDFPARKVAHAARTPVRDVYFPTDGMFSMIAILESGNTVEIASIGREGMVGVPAFLGDGQLPYEVLCQIPGAALRLEASALRAELKRNAKLEVKLGRYTQGLLTMAAQTGACNRSHHIGQRLARWLLQAHDQVGKDVFPLTQEFLGQMLGVRRAGVTEAAHALLLDEVITYRRGIVTVKDREALENAACECYALVRDEFARLLNNGQSYPPRQSPAHR
jgi:CRP-like cAMP-binding protein